MTTKILSLREPEARSNLNHNRRLLRRSLRSLLAKTTLLSFAIIAFIASPGGSENFKYESHGKRDPFIPLVGVEAPATSSLEDITSIGDIKLEGIASRPGGKLLAILNGEMVKEGDKFGEIQIKKVTKKNITISISGKNYAIDLVE